MFIVSSRDRTGWYRINQSVYPKLNGIVVSNNFWRFFCNGETTANSCG